MRSLFRAPCYGSILVRSSPGGVVVWSFRAEKRYGYLGVYISEILPSTTEEAVMEAAANSNAGLMRRIVQLETVAIGLVQQCQDEVHRIAHAEKNELQRDIETLCMQQSGLSGGIDVVSRMQSRRAAGFEQELDECKQKLALHAKENLNLQEELTELHRAKGRVADAFKANMDKNKELEKEVKFYQTRMAGAFNERDKAVLEGESLHATEKTMAKDLRDLHHRLEETKEQCCEQEKTFKELQQSMEVSALELKRVQNVVEKFWQIRSSVVENGDIDQESVDHAQLLLEDNDTDWVYSPVSDEKDCCKAVELALAQAKVEVETSKAASIKLEEELSRERAASTKLEYELALSESASTKRKEELATVKLESTKLQEDLQLTKAMSMEFKNLLEKERLARIDSEERISMTSDQLALKQYTLTRDVHQLQARQISLRMMVSAFLEAEKRQVSLLEKSVHAMVDQVKSEVLQEDTRFNSEEKDNTLTQDLSQKHKDDSREILAQALQEKVEALLLLSQQEERYYLEASTLSALELQITELSQKLSQVTGEKVKALLELADERQQIQQLQQRERELTKWLQQQKITYPGGRLDHASQSETMVSSLAGDSGIVPALEDKPVVGTSQLFIASGGYLKGWLRGLDISPFKTTSIATSSTSSVADATHSNTSDSRPPAEDAALQERAASLQRLAKSAHRLRMILVRVGSESQSGLPIQSAIGVIESVKAEAKDLAAALGCALPVSFQGALESSPENSCMETSPGGRLEGNDGEVEGTNGTDLVSMLGIEVTELLLATADLQIQSLRLRSEAASILE